MKPTSEQVDKWICELPDDYSDGHGYIAQRAAEWVEAQSAERIAELERQRGMLLEALVIVSNDLAVFVENSGGDPSNDKRIVNARFIIAEVRGEI